MNEHIFLLFPNEGEAKEQFKEYIKIYKKLMKQGYDNVSSSVIINIMKFPNAYMRKMAIYEMITLCDTVYLVNEDKYNDLDISFYKYAIKCNKNIVTKNEMDNIKDLIFISGPMTGVDKYEEYFKKAENYLESLGYKNIINPAKVEKGLPKGLTHDQYLSIDISILSKCKIVYVLHGWQKSKGAVEEVKYASSHNIKCIFQDDEA